MAGKFVKASTQAVYLGTNNPFGQNVPGASMMCWVVVASLEATNERFIFWVSSNTVNTAARCGISISPQAPNSFFRLAIRRLDADAGGGDFANFNGTTSIVTGTLYHVAITGDYSGGSKASTLYVNGVSEGTYVSAGWTGNSSNTVSLRAVIGERGDLSSTFGFDGSVDDARFYDRCLSSQEVEAIFHAKGRDRNLYGLSHRFLMNENSFGTTMSASAFAIIDKGANPYQNGTAIGSPTYDSEFVSSRAR